MLLAVMLVFKIMDFFSNFIFYTFLCFLNKSNKHFASVAQMRTVRLT